MMVGLMNTTDTTLLRPRLRLLNSHFSPGIRDSSGTPDALFVDSKRSIPPNTTISSLRTRIIDSNLLVVVGGGSSMGVSWVKSEISMLMFNVTCSSPDTMGQIGRAHV